MRFPFNCHNVSGAFSLQLSPELIILDRHIKKKKKDLNGIVISGGIGVCRGG